MLLVAQIAICQVPSALSYQGIARDASGETVKESLLGLRVSIIENDINGDPVYQEINDAMTTSIGYFRPRTTRPSRC